MRVTIVSRIYRPEPSAASLRLGAIADVLTEQGHDVDVLTARPPSGVRTIAYGERVSTFPVLRDGSGYVRGYLPYMSFDLPLALRLLVTRRPDAVLVEPPPTTGAVVRVICAVRRIPYVYNAADIWSDAAELEPAPRAVVRLLRAIERFAVRGASRLVTISDGVLTRLRDLGVTKPVTVTGFGADTRRFTVLEAATQPLFVYPGSYAPAHGAIVLVEALALFSASHPGYSLRFIGNGTERENIEARARELGVADQVEFLRPMPPEELTQHLATAVASLATVRPDTNYGYAYATKVFSSFASGCPVIFAGPGPTAAAIETANRHARAGIVCTYEPSEIASAMSEMADEHLSPNDRVALGAWMASTHSMKAVAEKVAEVLAGVTMRRR